MSEVLKQMSIKYKRASTYYPQANGLIEKMNDTLCNILSKVVLNNRRASDEHLSEA